MYSGRCTIFLLVCALWRADSQLSPNSTLTQSPNTIAPQDPTMIPLFPPTTAPTFRPTQPTIEGDDDGDPVGSIVFTMIALVLVAICCGCNNGRLIIDDFPGAETAAKEFREEMMGENRQLVVTIPAGTIPFSKCCCRQACAGKDVSWQRREMALFFTTRIKRRWLPFHAYVQFALGWISFAAMLVGLFAPSNSINSVIGSAALFLSELLLHTWYGFLRYRNCSCQGNKGFEINGEGDEIFEDMKYLFGVLFHNGDDTDRFPPWLDLVCLPFIAVLYLGVAIGTCATFITCSVLAASDNDNNRRRSRSREEDAEGIAAISVLIGVLIGCFAYPILFLVSETVFSKVAAAFAHHVVSEYYEAKLFRKSGKEFMIALVFKAFSDFCGVEDFGGEGDGFNEALQEFHDNLDNRQSTSTHNNAACPALIARANDEANTTTNEEEKEEIELGRVRHDGASTHSTRIGGDAVSSQDDSSQDGSVSVSSGAESSQATKDRD